MKFDLRFIIPYLPVGSSVVVKENAVLAEAIINVFMPDILFAFLFECSSVQILDYVKEKAIPRICNTIARLWGFIF